MLQAVRDSIAGIRRKNSDNVTIATATATASYHIDATQQHTTAAQQITDEVQSFSPPSQQILTTPTNKEAWRVDQEEILTEMYLRMEETGQDGIIEG
jgi:hypothetical protein